MKGIIGAKLAAHLMIIASLASTAFQVHGETRNENVGETIYMRGCVVCHGDDGAGAMPGIPDLGGDDGPLKKSDAELLSNIMNGLESEASSMPPKGGDDALTGAEAILVLEYMRNTFRELGQK